MAGIVGTPQGSGTLAANTTFTRSVTTAADADVLLAFVGVGQTLLGGPPVVSTVVWNSQNLSAVRRSTSAGNCRADVWALVSPAQSTTANMTVTVSGANSVAIAVIAASVRDIDGTFTDRNPANGNSTTPTNSVNTTAGDFVVDAMSAVSAGAGSVGANQTSILTTPGLGHNNIYLHASYEEGTGSPATMSWSYGGAVLWCSAAVSFEDTAQQLGLALRGVGR